MQLEVSAALGRPVTARLEQGIPSERITDLAHELGADLTVMGSHSGGGTTPWGLGGTVQRVFTAAHKSVFVAHGSSAAPKDGCPKRILIPLDGSLRSESVLPAAARLARGFGADLLLVHVVEETVPTLLLQAAECVELAHKLTARLESASSAYLGRLQRRLLNAGVLASTLVVRHTSERQCLLELSQEQQTDLIVISAHGAACDPTKSYGSVAPYLLAYSKVPLLVLQDLPDRELERTHDSGPASRPLRMSASYTPGML
jgi:nucleotide-binding universal stress UspA family protein